MDNVNLNSKVKSVFEIIKFDDLINELKMQEENASPEDKLDIWRDKIRVRQVKGNLIKEFDKDELEKVMKIIPEDYLVILAFASKYRQEDLISLLHSYYTKIGNKKSS